MKEYTNSEYIVASSYCKRTDSDCRFCIARFRKLFTLCNTVRKELEEVNENGKIPEKTVNHKR